MCPFVVNVSRRRDSRPGLTTSARIQGNSLLGPNVSIEDVRTVRFRSVGSVGRFWDALEVWLVVELAEGSWKGQPLGHMFPAPGLRNSVSRV